tara:strand:+ start:1582 stop:1683 length:102 start_codon:yes stop_codon:yes gene_type:complete
MLALPSHLLLDYEEELEVLGINLRKPMPKIKME